MIAEGTKPLRPDSPSRSVAFVVARLTSSRLPAKQLRVIGDRPLIQWTIEELRRCRKLDGIVVTTVNEPENEPLRDFCREQGVECFWFEGDVNHVTTRLRCAAEKYQAGIGVLVSGDCPLLQAEAIDSLVAGLENADGADYVQIAGEKGSPALQGLVIGRLRAWQMADDLADRPELKEHQFPLLGQRPDLFTPVKMSLPEELCLPYHHLSVDTLADVDFFNAVWHRLRENGRAFNLFEAVRVLKECPELREINGHVHQRTVNERPRKVLCLLDAGGEYGFGHLMRSGELARQIVERLSWPVQFVVDHPDAVERLTAMGFLVHWGAFGRPARPGAGSVPMSLDRFDPFDLVIIDIFDQRGPEPGWREGLGISGRIAVVENFRPWSAEADMLIGPNVLGKGDNLPGESHRILEGPSFLILRQEIRALQGMVVDKDLDLLAYLHDPGQREEVRKWVSQTGIVAEVPDGFSPDFTHKLARSRAYLSGFGTSFYEAVALRTVPLCWPDSDAHRADAERFYRWMGTAPSLVESIADLGGVWHRVGEGSPIAFPRIEDGTPRIVEALKKLAESPEVVQ